MAWAVKSFPVAHTPRCLFCFVWTITNKIRNGFTARGVAPYRAVAARLCDRQFLHWQLEVERARLARAELQAAEPKELLAEGGGVGHRAPEGEDGHTTVPGPGVGNGDLSQSK